MVVTEEAAPAGPQAATPVQDPVDDALPNDGTAAAPHEAAPENAQAAPENDVADQLAAPEITGNDEVDRVLAEKHKELVAALHRMRQKDADKAKAKSTTDEQTELLRQIAENAKPKPADTAADPFEALQPVYNKHFGEHFQDADSAKSLGKSVPPVVLDILQRFGAPALKLRDDRIAALEAKLEALAPLQSKVQEDARSGVRSAFGAGVEPHLEQIAEVSRTKGISMEAAAVVVLGPKSLQRLQAQRERLSDPPQPRSLNGATSPLAARFAQPSDRPQPSNGVPRNTEEALEYLRNGMESMRRAQTS